MEKESLKRISQIEDEMHLAKEKALADAEFYKMERQAEVNKMLYTKEYLELTKYASLAKNTKIYFGNNIPQTFFGEVCPNSILAATDKSSKDVPLSL